MGAILREYPSISELHMSKTTKLIVLSLSFLLASFVVVGGLGVKANTNDDGSYRQLGVYSEVLSRIRTEYVEEPNISAVTNGALHGLLESLDANSSYLDPTEYKDYKQRKEGKAGIGAAVSKRYGYAAVISVIPGGPADKAEIESGDIIEAIEGKSTRDMSLAEIDGLLTGPPGSVVNVSVVRPRRAQPVKSALTRAIVTDPPISDKMMEDGIGYIKVDDFPKGRSQEIANKLKALQKDGAKKIILDLRNSGDGEERRGHRDREPLPEPRHHHLPARPEVSQADLQRRSAEGGCDQPAAGGAGESRHGRTGGNCGRRRDGERARRRGRRQDFRFGLHPEGDRHAGWLGADPVGGEVLLAVGQGAAGHGRHAEYPGGRQQRRLHRSRRGRERRRTTRSRRSSRRPISRTIS